MSFPKIVNQMGSFGEKRKKKFFRFCRPILDIFGFPLLKIDPRQKQLKLEETDNPIIKSILSSLWQNVSFIPTSNGRRSGS